MNDTLIRRNLLRLPNLSDPLSTERGQAERSQAGGEVNQGRGRVSDPHLISHLAVGARIMAGRAAHLAAKRRHGYSP